MARGVPGEGPHDGLVGGLDGADLLVGADGPEHDGAVRPAGGEDAFVDGVPCHGRNFLFVAAERLKLFFGVANIKDFEQMVPEKNE